MFKKIYSKKASGADKNARKRGGFTLVELTVVIMLSALITFMVVSYSRLISDHVKDSRVRYDFFEDSATFKAELGEWMSLYDEDGAEFEATEDRKLRLDHYGGGEHFHELKFHQGTMEIGNRKVEGLNAIDKVEFYATRENGKGIIKCVLSRYDRDGNKEDESVLIFAPRCASIVSPNNAEGNVDE